MDEIGSQCSLCTDAETFENPILNCIGCGVNVHVLCYGVATLDGNWKCSPCQSNEQQPVCKLCVQNGGALKKTSCGGWVHVLCGLFTKGCRFLDNDAMEPVDISCVSEGKKDKKCTFCQSVRGFASLCDKSKCKNRIHISCAHKTGCLKEENDKHGKIKFRAYCHDHKPASSRRISSEFVRFAALKQNKKKTDEKKAKEKGEKQNSSELNTQWLVYKSQNANESSSSKKRQCEVPVNEADTPKEKQSKTCDDRSNKPTKKSEKKTDEKKAKQNREKQNISELSTDHSTVDKPLRKNESSSVNKGQYDESLDEFDATAEKISKNCDDSRLVNWNSFQVNALTASMEDIFENKENFHTCYKDERITKLKTKNKKLKEKMAKLEDLNASLQQQLLCAKQFLQMPSGRADVCNQDVIQALKNRIVPQISEDKSEIEFPNGVKILVKTMQQLETVPGTASCDRLYVNTSFVLFFGDKHIQKKIKRCRKTAVELPKLRETVLKILRESNRHQIVKDLYEYRVYNDGVGDLAARVRLFKLIFRTKFNNWWNANAIKSI